MKAMAKIGVGLSQEERNLLSVAYKNVIGARRASWRIISSLEFKGKEKAKEGDEDNRKLTTDYKNAIEKELQGICADILDLLDTNLIPSVNSTDKEETGNNEANEAYVFYYKM